MRILYLAHRLPFPPNKGDKLRSFRHLRQLAKNHQVWCACFVDRPQDLDYVAPLRTYCEDVIAIPLSRTPSLIRGAWSLATGHTVTEGVYANRAMRRALNDLVHAIRLDLVVAYSSAMAPYALRVPAGRRVIDLCDLDSRKWRAYSAHARFPLRRLYAIEANRLAHIERRCLDEFDAVSVITSAEARALCGDRSAAHVHVITNGVDPPRAARSPDALSRPGRVVGFLGVMNYRPNVDAVRWFVQACWPAIRREVPDAVFRIVGRWPCRAVRRLARVPGVVVVGEVQDVTPELERFDVSVAPLRIACGLQNKVLEAMASAVPVVLSAESATCVGGTPGETFVQPGEAFLQAGEAFLQAGDGSRQACGAFLQPDDAPLQEAETIAPAGEPSLQIADAVLKPGEPLCQSSNADAFASAVTRLLHDPVERRRIGENGRDFVTARHRWDDALRAFELFATGAVVRTTDRTDLEPSPAPVPPNLADRPSITQRLDTADLPAIRQ